MWAGIQLFLLLAVIENLNIDIEIILNYFRELQFQDSDIAETHQYLLRILKNQLNAFATIHRKHIIYL